MGYRQRARPCCPRRPAALRRGSVADPPGEQCGSGEEIIVAADRGHARQRRPHRRGPRRRSGGKSSRSPEIRFVLTSTSAELLAEEREHYWWPGARVYYGNRRGSAEIHQQFLGLCRRTPLRHGAADPCGRLDHKGLALDLVQRNAEVVDPVRAQQPRHRPPRNNPAVGRVEFADNATRWTAAQARSIDYYVHDRLTCRDPVALCRRDRSRPAAAQMGQRLLAIQACGTAARRNCWTWRASIAVAASPLSVIVADFFHWTAMGDYRFDPDEYPDPKAMMRELDEMGVRLMVSVWPTVSPRSENYEAMRDEGLLVGSDQGVEFHQTIRDKGMDVPSPVAFYDPTNPSTRQIIWSAVKANYYDLGVRAWWLDACEPELNPGHPANLAFYAGPGAEVASIYPRENARLFAEGCASAPRRVRRSGYRRRDSPAVPVSLGGPAAICRSRLVRRRASNLGVCCASRYACRPSASPSAGIPWWTTDIGGFHGGDATDPDFRELVVRWFQYGAFCPLFRLHGNREPRTPTGWDVTGGPNEVWTFGDEAYEIIRSVMLMRERLRPYLHAHQLDPGVLPRSARHAAPVRRLQRRRAGVDHRGSVHVRAGHPGRADPPRRSTEPPRLPAWRAPGGRMPRAGGCAMAASSSIRRPRSPKSRSTSARVQPFPSRRLKYLNPTTEGFQ